MECVDSYLLGISSWNAHKFSKMNTVIPFLMRKIERSYIIPDGVSKIKKIGFKISFLEFLSQDPNYNVSIDCVLSVHLRAFIKDFAKSSIFHQ